MGLKVPVHWWHPTTSICVQVQYMRLSVRHAYKSYKIILHSNNYLYITYVVTTFFLVLVFQLTDASAVQDDWQFQLLHY